MSKKKKVDLSTELADLIMDGITSDEGDTSLSGTTGATRVIPTKDADPDPTLAISKTTVANLDKPSNNESSEPKTRSVQIDMNKTTSGFDIQRGVGARAEEVTKIKKEEQNLDKTEASFSAEKDDASAVKELSKFFSSSTKNSNTQASYTPAPSHGSSSIRHSQKRAGAELILTAEASLVQSDQLRIAQERILELEKIVENLRGDNEELVAAGETLKNRSDDLKAQLERAQLGTREKSDIFNEELVVLRTSMSAKSEELVRTKLKIEELEARLSGDLKKIRVRERELENRLELIKLESQAVIKNKDEIVLDLKRKIDQLNYELENYRSKGKELNRVLEDNRERVRRTVKALRLALSMLEGDDQDVNHLKKAE